MDFFLKEVSRSIAACFSRYSTPLLPIQCPPHILLATLEFCSQGKQVPIIVSKQMCGFVSLTDEVKLCLQNRVGNSYSLHSPAFPKHHRAPNTQSSANAWCYSQLPPWNKQNIYCIVLLSAVLGGGDPRTASVWEWIRLTPKFRGGRLDSQLKGFQKPPAAPMW